MTRKQAELLKGIIEWQEKTGRSPSFREIAAERGVQVRAVQCMVEILVREGLLKVSGGRYGFSVKPKGLLALGTHEE